MNYTTLGRTGLRVSVMGLGCGGYSCLGVRSKGEDNAMGVVRAAVDAGVNLLDTAEGYGNEEAIGRALAGMKRDDVIISTKTNIRRRSDRELKTTAEIAASLEASLRKLQRETVDVYFLWGLRLADYDYATEVVVPELRRQQEAGKVRFIGATESFGPDPDHAMLRRALEDDWCDVIMVGFNVLNQTARTQVFPKTRQKNVGTMVMMAVRNALCRPTRLHEVVDELIDKGELDVDAIDREDPLGFLVHDGGASSVIDASYRFARDEPGVDTTLMGTGDLDHLRTNIETFEKPALPDDDVRKLKALFARVHTTYGD